MKLIAIKSVLFRWSHYVAALIVYIGVIALLLLVIYGIEMAIVNMIER